MTPGLCACKCVCVYAEKAGGKERYAYILAPQQMMPGDTISSGSTAGIKTGNSLPLSAIPLGTALHNVEMHPGRGGQLARSAGTAARLISKGVRCPTSRIMHHATPSLSAILLHSTQCSHFAAMITFSSLSNITCCSVPLLLCKSAVYTERVHPVDALFVIGATG